MPLDIGESLNWTIWEPPPWHFTELYDPADYTGETVTSYSTEYLGALAEENERPDPRQTVAVVGD